MHALPPPDVLLTAARRATDMGHLLALLGLPAEDGVRRALRRRLRGVPDATSHWPSRLVYSRERLAPAVSASTSFAGVLRLLGVAQAGGTQAHVARRVRALGLDTSHFTGQAHARGRSRPRLRADEVLVLLPPGAGRRKPAQLRRALIDSGVPHRCAVCDGGPEWRGRPLVLIVDHLDGDWLDNRPDNLRFLCPNCHAQTATWCRRKEGP